MNFEFDVNNKDHLKAFQHWRKTGKWPRGFGDREFRNCTYLSNLAVKLADRYCEQTLTLGAQEPIKEKESNPVDEIIETLRGGDCEATAEPYWLILDPKQNLGCSIDLLAGMIEGPFFSRQDAQNYLTAKKHRFSSRVRVYCMSGYASRKWKALCAEIKKREHQ